MQSYDSAPRDPVCGQLVALGDNQLQFEYADVMYRFCSKTCMQRFVEQPDIFTATAGLGKVAEDDRALRPDELEGALDPTAAAVIPHSPPAADPGS